MEQSESFKKLSEKILSFEQQLSLCDKSIKECEQSGDRAKKEIEEYFASCMNALASRKTLLLEEVADKVAYQKTSIDDTQVRSSVDACKQLSNAGSLTYKISKSGAEVVWQGERGIPLLKVEQLIVAVQLPTDFLISVQQLGNAVMTSPATCTPINEEPFVPEDEFDNLQPEKRITLSFSRTKSTTSSMNLAPISTPLSAVPSAQQYNPTSVAVIYESSALDPLIQKLEFHLPDYRFSGHQVGSYIAIPHFPANTKAILCMDQCMNGNRLGHYCRELDGRGTQVFVLFLSNDGAYRTRVVYPSAVVQYGRTDQPDLWFSFTEECKAAIGRFINQKQP